MFCAGFGNGRPGERNGPSAGILLAWVFSCDMGRTGIVLRRTDGIREGLAILDNINIIEYRGVERADCEVFCGVILNK